MAACSKAEQAQHSKGSIPISVPTPVPRAAASGVPGRRSWNLVLHKQAFHRLHRLGGKSLNLCLPALEEGHSLFSQYCTKHKILFCFSSCPWALLNTCQFSNSTLHVDVRQQLNGSFLQPRCLHLQGNKEQAGSVAGRLLSPSVAFLLLPPHRSLPLP